MPRFGVDGAALDAGLATIREEFSVPEGFPAEVDGAAEAATARPVERTDRRDLPFVTIDPPGSTDLDQALCIEPGPDGHHVVWYAIADVAAFVEPGDAIDEESRRRGVTLYLPDGRAPLHPSALSEGSASLLAGVDRPAVLWRLSLDPDGALIDTTVGRALVHSREQLTYAEAQARIDADDPLLAPLRTVGEARERHEIDRGGISLPVPEQEVHRRSDGYALTYRAGLPAEGWNAQISLLCGMAAATIALSNDVGMLRTLPPAPADAVDTLRRHAAALDVPWPLGATYGEVVRGADPTVASHAAFLHQCTRLFRGAGYRPLGAASASKERGGLIHAAIAAPYCHVTAPLRRLGDRFTTEAILSAVNGDPVPGWVSEALAEMPSILGTTGQRANAIERAAVDLAETLVLSGSIGQTFEAVVVDHRRDSARVQLHDPAIVATIPTQPALGTSLEVRVVSVDVANRSVVLEPVS